MSADHNPDLAPLRLPASGSIDLTPFSGIATKRAAEPPVHRTEVIDLAVPVAGHDDPDGVPLHTILGAIQRQLPSAIGLELRGSSIVATLADAPSAAELEQLTELLTDRTRLLGLRSRAQADTSDSELTRTLLDDSTPDDQWLRSFRRYAVRHLIERDDPA